ncbi:hypothetical protein [Streptomyces sp. NBC_01320]|uniref:hypothetical protein n=1 Tax=Streptomyces sp. NBC_01320 TaxID=2903824 RepID=UPI002E10D78C|nr:hypothetical protein OG395_01920 [Streptomyces sp. NBC_01320]
MRARMSGGVGAGRANRPAYPIVNQAHLPQPTDRRFDALDRDPQQAGEIRPERRSAGDQRPIDPLGRRVDIDPDE